MMLSMIVLGLVGLIAYVHYSQGLFSATLSAIIAGIAAVVAFGYHEFLVRSVLKGAMGDLAHAVALVGVFALVYVILRVIFDKVVADPVVVPLMLDRVGGAAAGAVAGVFATGILVIALQTLPFGPSVLGYSRLAVSAAPVPIVFPPPRQNIETAVNNRLSSEKPEEFVRTKLMLPVDDIVVGVASRLSNGGALAGSAPMSAVHPDYLQELFLQRVGVQAGARRVSVNVPNGAEQVSVMQLYFPNAPLPILDAEPPALTKERWSKPLDKILKPSTSDVVLVARLAIGRAGGDPDGKVRMSAASVRVVAGGRNHFPIGTLDTYEQPTLRMNRPDDFLVVEGDGKVDFVFLIPSEDLGVDVKKKDAMTVGAGVFIEARRLGTTDLSGRPIKYEMPSALASGPGLIWKEGIHKVKPAGAAEGTGTAAAPSGPLEEIKVQMSAELPLAINVGAPGASPLERTFPAGKATLRDNKFVQLELDPKVAASSLSAGDYPVKELVAPDGFVIVQVIAAAPSKATNPWEWAEKIGQFELSGSANFKPRGAWVLLKQASGEDAIFARYNADADLSEVPKSEPRPTDVRLFFAVPQTATLSELKFAGQRIAPVSVQLRAAQGAEPPPE